MSDKAKKACQKKYEAAKAQYDRDPAIFLANGGTNEKGHRSAEEGNAATERVQEGL